MAIMHSKVGIDSSNIKLMMKEINFINPLAYELKGWYL